MQSPQPDSPPPPAISAKPVSHWLSTLRKCDGWKDWLLPLLKKQLNDAEQTALAAIESNQPVPAKAAAEIQVLRPFFKMLEIEELKQS